MVQLGDALAPGATVFWMLTAGVATGVALDQILSVGTWPIVVGSVIGMAGGTREANRLGGALESGRWWSTALAAALSLAMLLGVLVMAASLLVGIRQLTRDISPQSNMEALLLILPVLALGLRFWTIDAILTRQPQRWVLLPLTAAWGALCFVGLFADTSQPYSESFTKLAISTFGAQAFVMWSAVAVAVAPARRFEAGYIAALILAVAGGVTVTEFFLHGCLLLTGAAGVLGVELAERQTGV